MIDHRINRNCAIGIRRVTLGISGLRRDIKIVFSRRRSAAREHNAPSSVTVTVNLSRQACVPNCY